MLKYLARKEMRQQLTLEDWLKKIKKVQDPLKLTDILLSDWPFVNKVKVLLSLPKMAVDNNTGMRYLEFRLEDSGCFELAQVVRWLSFWNLPMKSLEKGLEWSEAIVYADVSIRRVVQREIYVREEANALQKSLALEEVDNQDKRATKQARLEGYEDELEALNNRYWELVYCAGGFESVMPAGILGRAFKSCRTDPEWYLCQWLREDCARRGGCCGRGCGCCEKARTTERQWNQGHCTSVCSCCIREQRRSDEDVRSEQFQAEQDFSFEFADMECQYSARLNRAYIWRLSFLDELDLCGFFE